MTLFSWQPEGGTPDSIGIETIVPEEILYEYDGPRVFTLRSPPYQFLLYFVEEVRGFTRYIAVPVDEYQLDSLKKGSRTVYEILCQIVLWVIDADEKGSILNTIRTSINSIPARVLPPKHIMLWPELQPILSMRLVGAHLSNGSVSADVLKKAVDGALKAMKKLAYGYGARLPELRLQRMAFGSLEIAFSAHEGMLGAIPDRPSWTAAGGALEDGLERLTISPNSGEPEIASPILDALVDLTTFKNTEVETVELGGTLFRRRSHYLIDRERAGVIRNLSEEHRGWAGLVAYNSKSTPTSIDGVIRRFDKENRTFGVRPRGKRRLIVCRVGEDNYESALGYFIEDVPIRVIGTRVGNEISVGKVEPLPRLLLE